MGFFTTLPKEPNTNIAVINNEWEGAVRTEAVHHLKEHML